MGIGQITFYKTNDFFVNYFIENCQKIEAFLKTWNIVIFF